METNWITQAVKLGLIEIVRTEYGQYADIIRATRHLVLPWYHWQEWGKLNRN